MTNGLFVGAGQEDRVEFFPMNAFSRDVAPIQYRLFDFDDPSELSAIMDGWWYHSRNPYAIPTNRHPNGEANSVQFDGHVEAIPLAQNPGTLHKATGVSVYFNKDKALELPVKLRFIDSF